MKVTIITATHNSGESLLKCIESIKSQDYKNIEHIVVDGGSTDNTLEIIKSNRNTITAYVSEKDSGIYEALNKGLRLSSGDIIGFLNSDDVLADNTTISQIVKAFETTACDVLYGDLLYKSKRNGDGNTKTIRYWRSNDFKEKSLKYGWMPPHPTLYCRKEIYDNLGFYEEKYRIASDYDYILRVFKNKHLKKLYLPITIVEMDMGGISNNSLRNIINKSSEDYQIIKKNHVGGFYTLIGKVTRKIFQFYNH
jgi:glycosyltransferase